MKIAILHGGTSTEKASSTINAGHVEAALERLGYKTALVDYDGAMFDNLRKIAPDLVWICVQGKGHGDGTAQAVLDFLGLPYTGSRTMGAAIINDKIICKELFQSAGIRTPEWQTVTLAEYRAGKFKPNIGYPFVAKAPTQGFSFGIELISGPEDLPKMAEVFTYDDPIFIEKFIPGHNATVGFLETKSGTSIFPPVGHVYDDEKDWCALIKSGSTEPVVARQYGKELYYSLCELAEKAATVTRAEIYGRVDFRVSDEDNLPYALEINAVPGLKTKGLYAVGAGLFGIDYDTMVKSIVNTSKDMKVNV
jgi:D-alanine-D-alanine ligase/UDP-N-acetylmuramate--alanine ligase